ncbi:MAG: transposase [Deltaproteobacteria bacterium]|nr:transposase [Deltaproteobacteria bacterium]
MASPLPHRKRVRLEPSAYAEVGRLCSITIAVRDRVPVFASPPVAASAVEVLREHAERTGVSVYAFCVMPDHVHLVVSPSARCDLVTFVGQFKNLSQRAAWTLGIEGAFWQAGFWDHFVRRDGELLSVIDYVLDNPVRAGLVATRDAYPFAGASVPETD